MISVKDYVETQARLLNQLQLDPVEQVIARLERARVEGRRVFLFGNGGSAATASHFACDLGKGTIQPNRPRFKVISLVDNVPTLTAYANDFGFDTVFEGQLTTLAQPGDLAIAFSGSGNSPNVVRAMEAAEKIGIVTIGFTGFDGGKLKERVALNVHVPVHSFPLVEDVHLMLTHAICEVFKLPHDPH
jgi:D-sedoheptulose 7-phosphate isomerase